MSKAQKVLEVLEILEKHSPYLVSGQRMPGEQRRKSDNPLKPGRTSKKIVSPAEKKYRWNKTVPDRMKVD